jgi:hypothetical protein
MIILFYTTNRNYYRYCTDWKKLIMWYCMARIHGTEFLGEKRVRNTGSHYTVMYHWVAIVVVVVVVL